MGLSNEERYRGLMYAVNRMYIIGKKTSLESFTSMLWHAFLGKQNNSAHWILGSSATANLYWGHMSPWGVAVTHHTDDVFKERSPFDRDPDLFDVFDHHFNIQGLLHNAHKYGKQDHESIYEIYLWSEQALYNLRRYEDSFSKDLGLLDCLLSTIQGECFNVFQECECFAKAYIVHRILKIVYHNRYPYRKEEWDDVTNFLDKGYKHFDMRSMEMEVKELAEIHLKLIKDPSQENKFIAVAQMMFRKLHDHRDNEMIKKYIPQEILDKAKAMYEDKEEYIDPRPPEKTIYGLDQMFERNNKDGN